MPDTVDLCTHLKTSFLKLQLKWRYFWMGHQGFIKLPSVNQNFPLISLFTSPPTFSAWLILRSSIIDSSSPLLTTKGVCPEWDAHQSTAVKQCANSHTGYREQQSHLFLCESAPVLTSVRQFNHTLRNPSKRDCIPPIFLGFFAHIKSLNWKCFLFALWKLLYPASHTQLLA